MQSFTQISSSDTLQESLALLLQNDETALSCSSGTAFPTTNLYVGILCMRTDLGILYQLKDMTPTWVEVANLNSRAPVTTVKLTRAQLQANGTLESGIYTNSGDGLGNSDNSAIGIGGASDWWHVIHSHTPDNNGFDCQLAISLSSATNANQVWFRTSTGGTWTQWQQLSNQRSQALATVQTGTLVYATDTGTTNAYAITLNPAVSVLTDGMEVSFRTTNPNNAASTLNVGPGAVNIVDRQGNALVGGEIAAGVCRVKYNAGANHWKILFAGGTFATSAATQAYHAVNLGQLQNGSLALSLSGLTINGTSSSAYIYSDASSNDLVVRTGPNTAYKYFTMRSDGGLYAPYARMTAGGLYLPNQQAVYGQDGNGNDQRMMHMSADNKITLINSVANTVRVVNQAYTAELWYCDNSGNTWAAGNVAAYSDERVKTDWKGLSTDFIERIARVKNGIYRRIDEAARDQIQVGVSAQSLREVMPEAVIEDERGMLSVSYGNAALAAVIELAKEVVELRRRIAALEAV